MKNFFLPKNVNYIPDSKEKNKGLVIIEPCYPGYGITWGNALRRVLLSSLPGAAVSVVKIKGAKHEFATIDNVKEDVLEIILNLKNLRLKIFRDEPVHLKLRVKGEKEITAADFEKSADYEIINRDLHIATLTDKKADFQMEVIAEKGYGYVPSEQKDSSIYDLGTIVIDSIFSPVQNVGLKIENVRVGKRTDFNKIILSIETDGTVSPWEAFKQAVEILSEQFIFLKQISEKSPIPLENKKKIKTSKSKKIKKVKAKTTKKVKKKRKIKKKK